MKGEKKLCVIGIEVVILQYAVQQVRNELSSVLKLKFITSLNPDENRKERCYWTYIKSDITMQFTHPAQYCLSRR